MQSDDGTLFCHKRHSILGGWLRRAVGFSAAVVHGHLALAPKRTLRASRRLPPASPGLTPDLGVLVPN